MHALVCRGTWRFAKIIRGYMGFQGVLVGVVEETYGNTIFRQ
jgi:hypothetical protein